MTEASPEPIPDDLDEMPTTDASEAVDSDGEAEAQDELDITFQDPDAEVLA